MSLRILTLGNDASFGGWGTCLADQDGPIRVGHVKLGPPTKAAPMAMQRQGIHRLSAGRTRRLRAYLDGPMSHLLSDAVLMRLPTDPPVRVAVEIPPIKFKGGRASAYLGVARVAGPIEVWGARPHLAYPWAMEPEVWRFWWGIAKSGRGRDSAVLKADAIRVVERNFGREWLAPFKRTKKGGPMADVAESILIAVGCSRNQEHAPSEPEGWPAAPVQKWHAP